MENKTLACSESEKFLIGCVLMDDSIFEKVACDLKADEFFFPNHKLTWQAMLKIVAAGENINRSRLRAELINLKLTPEHITPMLDEMSENIPATASMWKYYAGKIKEYDIRRRMVYTAFKVQEMASDTKINSESLVAGSEGLFAAIRDYLKVKNIVTLSEQHDKSMRFFEGNLDGKQDHVALKTGLITVDGVFSGFRSGQFCVLGAKSGRGKSALATCIAANIAKTGVNVGFISLEMSEHEIYQRICSFTSRVPLTEIVESTEKPLSLVNLERIRSASSKIKSMPLFMTYQPGLNVDDLCLKVRAMAKNNGCQIVFIDYLGIIASVNPKQNEREKLCEITRRLKTLAGELKIPIVGLAQLNRGIKEDDEPSMDNLKGSGTLAEDADVIFLLHYKKPPEITDTYPAVIKLEKQRQGVSGIPCPVWFEPKLTLFRT